MFPCLNPSFSCFVPGNGDISMEIILDQLEFLIRQKETELKREYYLRRFRAAKSVKETWKLGAKDLICDSDNGSRILTNPSDIADEVNSYFTGVGE